MTPTKPVGDPLLNLFRTLAQRLSIFRHTARWLILATLAGILGGSASAILPGTAITPPSGAPAGREGPATQTGAAPADQIPRLLLRLPFHFSEHDRRALLMAGISAGFGSVFGTPLAGAVFGLEVLTIGNVGYDAIFPCFVAAFAGDYTVHLWRVHHTIYTVTEQAPLDPTTMLSAIAAGIAFGLTALLFARCTHAISGLFKSRIPYPPLRPFLARTV